MTMHACEKMWMCNCPTLINATESSLMLMTAIQSGLQCGSQTWWWSYQHVMGNYWKDILKGKKELNHKLKHSTYTAQSKFTCVLISTNDDFVPNFSLFVYFPVIELFPEVHDMFLLLYCLLARNKISLLLMSNLSRWWFKVVFHQSIWPYEGWSLATWAQC